MFRISRNYRLIGAALLFSFGSTLAHADAIIESSVPFGAAIFSAPSLSSIYPTTNGYYFDSLGFYNGNLLVAVNEPDNPSVNILQMSVLRNAGQQITGFGSPQVLASVQTSPSSPGNPFNGGMLVDGAGNLIYSVGQVNPAQNGYNDYLGQVNLASKNWTLTGVTDPTVISQGGISGMGNLVYNSATHTATLTFATDDQAGSNATWWTLTLSDPDAFGHYQTMGLTNTNVHLPADAFVFIPAGQGVASDSVLVEYNDQLVLYSLDASGLPVLSTGQLWVDGLNLLGPEVLGGLVRDPVTGDIIVAEWPFAADARYPGQFLVLRTDFNGSTVPEPSTLLTLAGGIGLAAIFAHRKGLLHRER